MQVSQLQRHTEAVTDEQFSRAVVAYIGRVPRLNGDPEADVAALGIGMGGLIPRIRAMLDDLYAADLQNVSTGDHFSYVAELGSRAQAWLRTHQPELSDEAVDAVSNQFAFNWR